MSHEGQQTVGLCSRVAMVVLVAVLLVSCSDISKFADDLANTVGENADAVADKIDELADATGRKAEDLAKDAKELAEELPGDAVERLRALSTTFGFGGVDVVCKALDKVASDGSVSTDELVDALASEAVKAGTENGTEYANQVKTILLEGDPDGQYDVVNMALDQVRACVL